MIGPTSSDVGDQEGDQAADRRQGQRRQLRDRADQLAVVDERPARTTSAAGSRRRHRFSAARCRRRATSSVGSNPISVTDPLPYARSAAMTRSPLREQHAAIGHRAAEGRQVGRARRDVADAAAEGGGRDIDRGASGGRAGASSGNADSVFGPVVPPTMTRRPPPATQPCRAAAGPSVSRLESTSCQTRRSSAAPGLDPLGQVLGVDRDDRAARLVLVGQRGGCRATMSPGLLGDDADDQLVRVVDGEGDLGRRDGLRRRRRASTSSSRPNAGGWA